MKLTLIIMSDMIKRVFFRSWALPLFCACLFNSLLASGNEATASNRELPNCGLELSVPAELYPDQGSHSDFCPNSYLDSGGTVLLLGAVMGGHTNPSLLETIPSLRIYSKSIDNTLSANNGSGIRRSLNGVVENMDNFIEIDCSLKRKTQLSEISENNWRGWIAEDVYQEAENSGLRPDYCKRYSKKNRCVRMIIGNSKESAIMGQYCLTRLDEDFDLDAGLSYNIFLRLIRSIRFSDG